MSRLVLIALVLVGCTGGDDSEANATREQCVMVQRHVASLRMGQIREGSRLREAELRKHQEGFAATTDVYLNQCTAERSAAWATCMLALKRLDGAAGC